MIGSITQSLNESDAQDSPVTKVEAKSWDPIWEELFRTQVWGKYPQEHVIRFVARNFYQATDRTTVQLLDLGAGPGAVSWYMAREGFSVSAIDGSPSAITQLRNRLAAEELTADARQGDLMQLPWGEASFDGVVDNTSMYANPFEHCIRIVQEVRRVLKPGGVFCSASFTDRTSGYGLGIPHGPGEFSAVPEGPFKDRGFVTLLGRVQLDILFRDFVDVNIERVSWTLGQQAQFIELWVVTCRKGL
jgi:2-polyprenyl-3-methyl-5-hydroxy-6-metoxy-1,4-benzoquinol methylase